MHRAAHRLYGCLNGTGDASDEHVSDKACLLEALKTTLDSMAVGVIVVADKGRILYANQTAGHMLDAGSPVAALAGGLGAPDPDATRELREAIAAAQDAEGRTGADAIGVPLVNSDLTAAAAYVVPLKFRAPHAYPARPTAAVFIASASAATPADVSAVARIFRLTPAEIRLLRHLLAGARLTEAAAALGISKATVRTHQSRLFSKVGVSRRIDLVTLIGRLIPPLRRLP